MLEDKELCGVVIGRFQMPALTAGHREMLDFVLSRGHSENFIVLGVPAIPASANNPLDFEARNSMIRQEYGDKFIVLQLPDCADDETWSSNLDEMLSTVSLNHKFKLYGSRDNFIKHYTGRHLCQELASQSSADGRKYAGDMLEYGEAFRRGVIFAARQQYPHMYQTVDIAAFTDSERKYIVLCKKPGCTLWRFPGGFVDTTDSSLEAAAQREFEEETGAVISNPLYVVSMPVDDWRYRSERDKIMTALFMSEGVIGTLAARDDIEVAEALEFDTLSEDMLAPEHRPLYRALNNALLCR